MSPRRLLIIPLTIAALASGTALADDPAAPVDLGVQVVACETGAASEERVVVFRGSMPPDDRAWRLAMSFELHERAAGEETFARLTVPNFGIWQKSAPRARGYVIDKRVEGLAQGASYRVVVRFRWYARGGRIVRSAKRTSAQCRQPDAAPATDA